MENNKKIYIDYFDEGRIARITLDNPPMNLTTLKILDELMEAVLKVSFDDKVRVVVITAAGTRIFCGGSDLKEFPAIRDNFI